MNRNDKFKNIAEMKFRIPADLVKFILNVYQENCKKLDVDEIVSSADFAFKCGQMSILEMILVEMGVLDKDEVYQKDKLFKKGEDKEDD